MFKFSNIQTYHQQLLDNEINCVEVVTSYLANIKENNKLNAMVDVYAEEALQQAKALDKQRQDNRNIGPLHGVVIAIKDVICYNGHKVTAASKILNGFTSVYSATAIERLMAAGAIIIGSCNCDEFAMGSTNENSVYGPTLNAIDITKVPGGSSGGSAVAVQADMCMVSLGSDTGGSVRQPADFCGIVGLKPSYGRISRWGLIAYASSFDQIGIFANNVEDAALVLQTIEGADEKDSTAVKEKRTAGYDIQAKSEFVFGYFKEALFHPSLDKEIHQKHLGLLNDLRSKGHVVKELSFDLIDYVVPAYYVLTTAEASSNLGRYDGVRYGHRSSVATKDLVDFYKQNRSEGFSKEVKRRIMLGTFVLSAGYFDAYFTKAQQVRQLLVNKTKETFNKVDVLLLPTCPTTAFPIGDKNNDPIAMYLADIYTVFANLTGIPGISVPLFQHSNGMPFGVQVHSNVLEEETMLQAGNYLLHHYKAIES